MLLLAHLLGIQTKEGTEGKECGLKPVLGDLELSSVSQPVLSEIGN